MLDRKPIENLVQESKRTIETQRVYCVEECSELIKELCKYERNKCFRERIIEEACDVIYTAYTLLISMGVGDDLINGIIEFKCKRALVEESNGRLKR